MMLSNLSKRELIILGIVLIIIIFTVYYLYAYKPLTKEINQLETNKNRLSREVRITQDMVKKLPEMRERYNELTERTLYVNYFNISNDKLLVELKQITDNINILFRSYKPNATDNTIDIAMFIEADYYKLNEFLVELQKFEYWMDYKSMSIRPMEDFLQVNLSLKFYKKGLMGGGANE